MSLGVGDIELVKESGFPLELRSGRRGPISVSSLTFRERKMNPEREAGRAGRRPESAGVLRVFARAMPLRVVLN